MAFDVTRTAQDLASQNEIKPNIIVEIEGVDLVFSAVPILEIARWDKDNIYWDDPNVYWDGLVEKSEGRSYIDFSETTKNVSQQIITDKGGSSSAASMKIQIVNNDAEVSRTFSFDNITEILGKKANIYLNFADGSHPEDSVPLFRGFIDDYADAITSVILSVSHSENHKRQSFLDIYNSKLTSGMSFQTLLEQDIKFQQRDVTQETLSIEYISGGSLAASIVGNDITITITGTSKAKDIVKIIRETSEINYVLDCNVIGNPDSVQAPFARKSLHVDTVVNVTSTKGLFPSQDVITTYIRINDEIMEVLSIDSDTQLTVKRAEKKSFGEVHEIDDDVASIYFIKEYPVSMALKIMLSEEGNEFYESSDVIESFVYVDDSTEIKNGIIFSNVNIEEHTGLTKDDLLKIENSDFNDGEYKIKSFGVLDDGRSYIVVDGSLSVDTSSTPNISYKSKYDVLATGLGMQPNEVDVSGFEYIDEIYGNNFVEYDYPVIETIENAKEFIDTKILFSQGIYSIPRKARASAKFTSPPLTSETIPVFDVTTIEEIQKLRQQRTVHKYFYNNIAFQFDYDVLFEKFKSSRYLVSEDSFNRIRKVGNKQMLIKNEGLQDNNSTLTAIDRVSNRLLDRYKFAARYIPNVKVLYKVGYRLEVGDVIELGGENTKMTNLETGERDFPITQFEIVNKKINVEDATVFFDLLETGFSAVGKRYASFSPSSLVASGSTENRIILGKFLDCGKYAFERDKWEQYRGCKLTIRSKDYTFYEHVDFLSVDEFNNEAINISPLSSAPLEGYFVELAPYDMQPSNEIGDRVKRNYAFRASASDISFEIDNISFEVSDISKFKVNQSVEIHSKDYVNISEQRNISDITGNIITLDSAISFTPEVGYIVETYTFKTDDGDSYFFV